MRSAFVILVTLLLSIVLAGDVLDLTKTNFDKVVFGSKVPILVEFFSPGCGHCQRAAPIYEQVATSLKGIMPIAKVDVSVERELAGRYEINGVPTFKLFKPGDKTPIDYQGPRTASAISDYVTKALTNNVHAIADWDKFFAKDEQLPHVVLFTAKPKGVLFKSLAMQYQGRVVLGEVGSDSPLATEFNVDTFPTLLAFKSREDYSKFEGKVSPATVGAWFKELAPAASTEPPKKEVKAKPPPPKAEWVTGELSVCTKNCLVVVGAVDKEDAELANLLALYGADGKFQFVLAPDAAEQFGVTETPRLVVFQAKKNRYSVAAGWTESLHSALVDRFLGGDLAWTVL